MKRTYFHGTTADNLSSILKNGLSCNEEKLWNCSRDAVYLWCPIALALAEANGRDLEEDADYIIDEAIYQAFESSMFSLGKSNDCRAIVIELELDEDEVFVDDSCENMQHARCTFRDISIEEIKSIRISNDFSLLKAYFLSLGIDMDYSAIELTDIERKVATVFKNTEHYLFEELRDIVEWDNINIPELI